MDNELIESDHKFTNDGLLGVISGGDLVLKNLSTSLVIDVIITNFFGSSSGLSVFGEAEERGKGLLLEEMGISGKLVE